MIRKFVAGMMMAAVCMAPVGASALGLPKIPGVPKAAEGGAGAADVDKFLAEGAASTELFLKAQTGLALALANKEKRAEIMNRYDVVKKGLDAKDKKAGESQAELLKSNDALIAEQMAAADSEASLKNLSGEQKAAVAKSLASLGLAVLAQKQQIETGTQLVNSIAANPMMASKALVLKDSLGTLGSNLKMGGGYVAKLPGLFKAAGISVSMPTDATTKAEPVDFAVFADATPAP